MLAACAHEPTPPQVCGEVAHALAVRDVRCGALGTVDDVAASHQQTLECDTATAIRDRRSLEEVCFPAIDALPCDRSGPLPEECDGQIL